MKKIITYGTFDLLHYGHINLLSRARSLGDYLIVGLSTDEFNAEKGKGLPYFSYDIRLHIISAIRYVDEVIPESSWSQKRNDIVRNGISTFVIGDDWRGKFNGLNDICEVVYLDRTPEISTTRIKSDLKEPMVPIRA